MTRPDRSEAAAYFFTYIDQVPDGDIVRTLETQLTEVGAMLQGISDERSLHRYAPDKWTIRDTVAHMSDTERVFAFRALWFARGFDIPLPSFDQDVAVPTAGANARSWAALIDELRAVRTATLAFYRDLPAEAWDRRGTAGGNPFSVNGLAYICAGHVAHHVRILRERYLQP